MAEATVVVYGLLPHLRHGESNSGFLRWRDPHQSLALSADSRAMQCRKSEGIQGKS